MKLVLVQYPAINRYVIMRRDSWEAVRLEYPLVFDFENIDEFVKKAYKKKIIYYRYTTVDICQYEGNCLDTRNRKTGGMLNVYIEQPNGDLTLVYEPKGGFRV